MTVAGICPLWCTSKNGADGDALINGVVAPELDATLGADTDPELEAELELETLDLLST